MNLAASNSASCCAPAPSIAFAKFSPFSRPEKNRLYGLIPYGKDTAAAVGIAKDRVGVVDALSCQVIINRGIFSE